MLSPGDVKWILKHNPHYKVACGIYYRQHGIICTVCGVSLPFTMINCDTVSNMCKTSTHALIDQYREYIDSFRSFFPQHWIFRFRFTPSGKTLYISEVTIERNYHPVHVSVVLKRRPPVHTLQQMCLQRIDLDVMDIMHYYVRHEDCGCDLNEACDKKQKDVDSDSDTDTDSVATNTYYTVVISLILILMLDL
jgi:hypothetical protein